MPDQSTAACISFSGHLAVEEGKVFQQRYCFIDSKTKEMHIYTNDPLVRTLLPQTVLSNTPFSLRLHNHTVTKSAVLYCRSNRASDSGS
jgi:hypothetical protein